MEGYRDSPEEGPDGLLVHYTTAESVNTQKRMLAQKKKIEKKIHIEENGFVLLAIHVLFNELICFHNLL